MLFSTTDPLYYIYIMHKYTAKLSLLLLIILEASIYDEGVLSEGVLSGRSLCLDGVMYGGGFVRGGFVRGGFCLRGFCPEGVLSGGGFVLPSKLRYKDVVKRDMKALDINTATWDDTAADRATWRSTLKQHLKTGEEKLMNATADKRALRKERSTSDKPETTYKCDLCGRDCYSHIGLYSHKRRCHNRAT